MELERIQEIEHAIGVNRKQVMRLGVAILFLAGIMAAMLYYMIRGIMLPN